MSIKMERARRRIFEAKLRKQQKRNKFLNIISSKRGYNLIPKNYCANRNTLEVEKVISPLAGGYLFEASTCDGCTPLAHGAETAPDSSKSTKKCVVLHNFVFFSETPLSPGDIISPEEDEKLNIDTIIV